MNRASVSAPIAILLVLATAACGSGARGANASSAGRTAASPTPNALTGNLVAVTTTDATSSTTLRLVDKAGHVAAKAQFVPPPRPSYSNCATIIQPPVRVAAAAAYFVDNTGVVRRLASDGSVSKVATFPLTNPQQAVSFAVSPDGRQLIAIVLSSPPLHNPPPQKLGDPVLDSGSWSLDLETAMAGGTTSVAFHRDLGASVPSPTVITGWDAAGPTATLNSWICTQNVLPSLRYTSGALIHLAMDGTHLERIGGADCQAWDELSDGTVLCGGSNWASFTVRRHNGDTVWSGGGDELFYVSLSPDGNAVASLDGTVYLRYTVGAASSARHASPQTTILGWADPAAVVVEDNAGHIGLAPATDPTMFTDLGIAVEKSCPTCGFYEATVIGTIR